MPSGNASVNVLNLFKGRKLIIATKHKKDMVIAPILEKSLGVKCLVPNGFDTDALGTFTGEIERPFDPLTTAKEKCLRAMAFTDSDLAVASEGSFGPHPSIFFIPADDEWLFFMDKKNGLEIYAREITSSTNFAGIEVKDKDELAVFANSAGFPAHGLILRYEKDKTEGMVKGIAEWGTLELEFLKIFRQYGKVFVETDMRAMFNPTRMAVIKALTQKLVSKIMVTCPRCNTPGFDIVGAKKGLPCEYCGTPTRSIISYYHGCLKCGLRKEELYPNGKKYEDPRFCDVCNP